eukprot:scaffold82076_cov52-Attheya_sp.AAC.3
MEEALQAIHQTPSPSGRSAPIDIVPNSSRQRYHTNPTNTDDTSDEDADAGETDLFRDMVGSVPRHASSLSMRGGSLIHRGRLGGGARSLPPPRAPFLSSQTDPNDRLHR